MTNLAFEHPCFFFSAAALAALLALYLWYRRSRRKEVAALFLWDKPESTPQSGSRFELRRFPPSFWLEAFILILLTLASASPFLIKKESYPPLAVVFDNSFSMRADDGTLSPAEKGKKHLARLLGKMPGRRILCISAGLRPRLLADTREKPDSALFGNAEEPSADLAGAIALARSRIANGEILVITDRRPEIPPADDISWFASGKPLPNTAIVNARRTGGRLLLEIMNCSAKPQESAVELIPGGRGEKLVLAPGERRKIVMRLPVSAEKVPLKIHLDTPGDPLPFDNETILLPEQRAPVRHAFSRTLPETLRNDLYGALQNNPGYSADTNPELLFTTPGKGTSPVSRVIWHTPLRPRDAVLTAELISPLSGHPLLRGLPLQDLRWATAPGIELPGRILLRRGDTPLLSEVRRLDGKTDLHFNLSPEKSNLAKRPFWPIFFWNLAEYLRGQRPGPERANYRAGDTVRIRTAAGTPPEIRITGPDGSTSTAKAVRHTAFLRPDAPGIYRIETGDKAICSIGVSALNGEESNLDNAAAFQKEARLRLDSSEHSFLRVGIIALLLAGLLMLIHQYHLGTWRRDL